MKFDRLAAGMTVYTISKERMGNTTMKTTVVRPVSIISVDTQSRAVRAIVQGGRERTYSEPAIRRWRESRPVLVPVGLFGQRRLATRKELEEVKAPDR